MARAFEFLTHSYKRRFWYIANIEFFANELPRHMCVFRRLSLSIVYMVYSLAVHHLHQHLLGQLQRLCRDERMWLIFAPLPERQRRVALRSTHNSSGGRDT